MNGPLQFNGRTNNNIAENNMIKNINLIKEENNITEPIELDKIGLLDNTTDTENYTNIDNKDNVKFKPKSEELFKTENYFKRDNFLDTLKREKNKQDSYKNNAKMLPTDKNENNMNAKYFIEDKIKQAQILDNIKNNIKNIDSKNVYGLLISNGLSPNKIDLEILNSVIAEANINKNLSTNQIETALNENIFTIDSAEAQKSIIEILLSNNMEITSKNISAMESVYNKMNAINDLNEQSILNLIKENKNLSLDNIYKSRFQTNAQNTQNDFKTELSNDQFQTLFYNEDIIPSDGNLSIAQKLLQNDIPITKENINKYIYLPDIENNLDYKAAFSNEAQNIKLGKITNDIYLNDKIDENIANENNKLAEIENISKDTIRSFAKSELPQTLNNLLTYNNVKNNVENNINNTADKQSETLQTNILNIQKHMTQTAINRLSSNGILMGQIPIKKALNLLENANNIDFKQNLRLMGADVSGKNIARMQDVYNKIPDAKTVPEKVYADIVNEKINFNMKAISNRTNAYEQFATAPSTKFGDRYSNIESQINSRLVEMNLQDTAENIAAYKILSKNNIDVNLDNLNEIKMIRSKLDNVSERLNPTIIARMIRDNINPLNMHINDVINYINEFENTFGIDKVDNISEYIYRMDREDKTDKRDKIIAFYRALNIIRKNDDIALGVAIKNKSDLTLNNIFEASKYIKNNESYLVDNIKSVDNIREILEDKNIRIRNDLNKSNIDRLANINYQTLEEQINNDEFNLEQTVDEYLINNTDTQIIPDNIDIQLQTVENMESFILTWFQSNSIQSSLYNMETINAFINNPNALAQSINEIVSLQQLENLGTVTLDSNLDLLKEQPQYEDLLKNLSEQLTITEDYEPNRKFNKKILTAKRLLEMQDKINNSDNSGLTSFPIKINESLQTLNIHVINDNILYKENIETYMNLTTNNIGQVQVNIKIAKSKVSLTISSENQLSLKKLEQHKIELYEKLKDEGIEISDLDFKLKVENPIIREAKMIEKNISDKKILEKNMYKYNAKV